MLLKENYLLYKWMQNGACVCWKTSGSLGILICGNIFTLLPLAIKMISSEPAQKTSYCIQSLMRPQLSQTDCIRPFKIDLGLPFLFPGLFDSVAQERAPALRMMWRIESRLSRPLGRQTWRPSFWQRRLQFLGSLPIQLMVLVSINVAHSYYLATSE